MKVQELKLRGVPRLCCPKGLACINLCKTYCFMYNFFMAWYSKEAIRSHETYKCAVGAICLEG